ncbi:secretion ATPase [Providencia stuartii]|uniref:Secretion ATPase n=1 Tax=Providencia stuartii TaxID=588 RepID=A0AAI9I069_PROST|nr:secretion ATPase [Providencia stuartii]ELR5043026.1 secretion ATPase [Providencia rettgeri]MTB39648.1 secretion ATPase [Providencia sp. wls1949]MTC08264.1 secretion ATPase [Providencia sp. wls1948]QIC17757.1 secretion ATPase [Providencia vermicola]
MTSLTDLAVVENERKITEAIASLQITRVFVAHRPERIKSADKVFNLQLNRWVSPYD